MKIVTDTMMGNKYPFFLGNSAFGRSYYLYEIYSPCLNSNGNPTFSLKKVSERVEDSPESVVPSYLVGKDSDIISYVSSTKKVRKTYIEYLRGVYRNDDVVIEDYKGKYGFPITEINLEDEGNILQKQAIISLRDSLRWKAYKFSVGKRVDLLYTPTEFVVYEFISGENNTISLKPIAVYKNSDIELKNPLKVNLSKLNTPKKNSWDAEKFSDVNIALKLFEWESFRRPELYPTKD